MPSVYLEFRQHGHSRDPCDNRSKEEHRQPATVCLKEMVSSARRQRFRSQRVPSNKQPILCREAREQVGSLNWKESFPAKQEQREPPAPTLHPKQNAFS
jgi:hypothetical protein